MRNDHQHLLQHSLRHLLVEAETGFSLINPDIKDHVAATRGKITKKRESGFNFGVWITQFHTYVISILDLDTAHNLKVDGVKLPDLLVHSHLGLNIEIQQSRLLFYVRRYVGNFANTKESIWSPATSKKSSSLPNKGLKTSFWSLQWNIDTTCLV